MGSEKFILVGFRSLVLIAAAGVIALGAWLQQVIHDAEVRGDLVLELIVLDSEKSEAWRDFINVVVDSQVRVWLPIGAACFTFLAGLFIVFSSRVTQLTAPKYVLLPLELLAMFVMAGAFAVALSLAVRVGSQCAVLDPSSSSDLKAFEMICPLTKAFSITGGAGWLFVAIASLMTTIDYCHHRRTQKCCSFEPTASALGMGHGYQAVLPPPSRSNIPTLYDPLKPVPGTPARPPREDEMGLEKETYPTRRDSTMSEMNKEMDIEKGANITGPLSLQKPDLVKQMRPARPWSEMLKKRDEEA
ncbi:hypothetical protein P154DRAFT_533897 [Amniculicola lignicola CBS 123094]|uniref:Uncharacterized protein n=1 Tax=Amniculicola lignicola CBS 123094 TaxID=1392246 RepID=A0A6A5WIT9_9PLEO|nr:hypothetical protein P154DRAFT_533897 [Amniculicola lignicola CBS 123094]